MNIAILGIGSIGAYVAAMFAENTNHNLYLLARSNYSTVHEQGLVVEEGSKIPTWKTHRFTVVDDIHKIPACDLIILAVRESQLPSLLPDLEALCLDHTKVVCLQNGINFEKKIQEALPKHRLYSGTCWIKVTTLALGQLRHDFGNNIKLGRYSPTKSIVPIESCDKEVKDLLTESKLSCDLEDNIQSIQLTKLALNIPFFILMAQNGKTVSEILADQSLNRKREELQREIIEASKLFGSPIDESFLASVIESLRKLPLSAAPSPEKLAEAMRLELPGQAGALLNFLETKGVKLEKLKRLYDQLNVSCHSGY